MSIMSGSASERAAGTRLGRAVRAVRKEQAMTLAQVAEATGLSQPFLSQLELGRTRPSMRSLFRIATALGTTQPALLGLAAGDRSDEPVRSGEGALVRLGLGGVASGGARLLLHDPGADVTEFVGVPGEFGEFFCHDRPELLYVVRGTIELELRERGTSRFVTLAERDSIAYGGRVEHRFRRVGTGQCVVLGVH